MATMTVWRKLSASAGAWLLSGLMAAVGARQHLVGEFGSTGMTLKPGAIPADQTLR
jgi:hypothetical protein